MYYPVGTFSKLPSGTYVQDRLSWSATVGGERHILYRLSETPNGSIADTLRRFAVAVQSGEPFSLDQWAETVWSEAVAEMTSEGYEILPP